MTAPGQRWHRDLWAEAVWSSSLPPLQRLVALAYADHARDRDTAWLGGKRLCERTGLGRTAALDARQSLVDAGWLAETLPATARTPAHYRLVVVAEGSARRTPLTPRRGSARRTPEVRETDPTGPADGPQASASRTPGVRETDPTSGLTSDLTSSLSTAQEASPVHTTTITTRETTGDGHTFGARAIAALGRADLSAHQLDQAHRRAADRLGLVLAADAVHAVASLQPVVRNLAAYMARLSDDDLRALAEQRRQERERPARPARPAARSHCGECSPTRRLEHPDDGRDLGPCPRCHPAAVRKAS